MSVTKKDLKFQSIEENPSLLGFGLMRLPRLSETEIDFELGFKMIDYAYNHGVNYFDTAYPYHLGKSEVFAYEALKKYPRESYFLADKMPIWECKTLDDVKRIFNEQLKKCGVEYFDYYLCHAMSGERFKIYKRFKAIEFLQEMKKEGKIRHLGFSFHGTADDLLEMVIHEHWDFVQIQFNYFDYDFIEARKLYEILEKHNLPVIVMEPVRGGMLASLSEKANAILKEASPNSSIASWALRFVGSFKNVICVLSGMSDFSQVEDNIKTMTDFKPLSKKESEVLDNALNAFLEEKTILCTKCEYCLPCSKGVKIPKVFHIYNNYKLFHNAEFFVKSIDGLEESEKPANCIKCGKCMKACPQSLTIFQNLEMINEEYEKLKTELKL